MHLMKSFITHKQSVTFPACWIMWFKALIRIKAVRYLEVTTCTVYEERLSSDFEQPNPGARCTLSQ